MGRNPLIKEIHLGGGTPTFFAPDHLSRLIKGILEKSELVKDHEFGFEALPATTSLAHLETLKELGFTRLSIGIQDFDSEILRIINRNQDYEDVLKVTNWARDLWIRLN